MGETKLNGRGIFGIILVLIGIAWLADRMDLLSPAVEDALFTWPVILIILGILFLVSQKENITGWILLGIGLVFWVPDVFHISTGFREIFWPVVFIALGLLILFKAYGRTHRKHGTDADKDRIDNVAILGGNERRITSQAFKGGQISAIFGGTKIDFRDADLAAGENVLDVIAVFGGATFIVPNNWEIKVEVTSVFGGFDDKRRYGKPENIPEDKVLVIKGATIFGGGEIKDV